MYTKHKWQSEKFLNFEYIKYLPKDYDDKKEYPIVFYLHGAGERGDELDDVAKYGYLQHIREEGKEYPFIIIAPQCPKEKYWGCFTESLLAFFDWICDDLSVDESRIYLTGNSMGGTGTWMLAMAAPDKFAAIAPICGSGIYWYACIIKDLPIYVYHGDCDEIVPITESINMLKRINSLGGNAKIEICYGVGHNSWDIAYSDEKLEKWLLAQRKNIKE